MQIEKKLGNIRNSFLNKNIIDDLFDGSFWFGKNHNIAKNIIEKKLEIKKEGEEEKIEEKKVSNILNNPNGYIELLMIGTNPNELFVDHNITMQYLTINGNKFIKELRLTNQGRELDCYSEGENELLTIEKISSTQLLLTLLESNGKVDKFIVINGQIIS